MPPTGKQQMAKLQSDQAIKECTFDDAIKVEAFNHLDLLRETTMLPQIGLISVSDKANQTAVVTPFEIYDSAQAKIGAGIGTGKDGDAAVKQIDNADSKQKPNSKVQEMAQRYTVSQLLEVPPLELPHNFMLQAEFGATPQAELNRLKSSYLDKYAVSLGWAAELKPDTAKTSLVFTSEQAVTPEIVLPQYESAQSESKLAATAKQSECVKQVDQQVENEKLGLPLDATVASQANRKIELAYRLDPTVSPQANAAIFNARTYGIDESLPPEEIERLIDHPGRKRWAEVLQMAPDSSTEQILQAQQEQIDKYSAGLQGQARTDAEQALRIYWDAISVDLSNPEQATADQVKPLIMEQLRYEETVAMGLDPYTPLVDISDQQESRRMQLGPGTSHEELVRIRYARQLFLPDDASAEEVKELERDWSNRRVQLALEQDCQI